MQRYLLVDACERLPGDVHGWQRARGRDLAAMRRARALLGHAGRIGVRAQRSESGRGAMAARAATAAAATRAGRTLRIERAGRRGHGPMRARRAWAAASMPQSRAKYARRRRVLRRAAAAYGVVYLAFYSARDVQTLTNQRGAQRLEMVLDGCLTPSIVPSLPAVHPGPLKSRSRG